MFKKIISSPRKFITSTLLQTNVAPKPSKDEALRQLPLPPRKKLDASSLPPGCVKSFLLDGDLPENAADQAEIVRFCLKNKQPQAMAWLFLRLEDAAPEKQQSLQLAHTDEVPPEQRLNGKDAQFLAKWLAEWIGSLPLLNSVDVSNNFFGDEGVKAFAALLTLNLPLQHLNVSSSASSGRSITKLTEALIPNTALLSIDFSFNACEGGVAFGQLLQQNTTLQSLDISNMRPPKGSASAAEFINPIAEGLAQNNTLLHFGGAYLPMTEGMINAIQSNTTLTSINLNATADTGFITRPELLQALANHPSLKRIQIYRCILQEAGIDALIALIRKRSLEAIDVSHCDLSSDTVATILADLRDSPSMQHVDLSGNNLKGQGKRIAEILKHNQCLTSLQLAEAYLSDKDLADILLAVDDNHSLLELNLADNGTFTEEQGRALQERLLLNKRPSDAQQKKAGHVLRKLLSHHNVPLDVTMEISGFIAAMGAKGTDTLEKLAEPVDRLERLHPSE
jgi:Ran GTPase-activating protein (RanGAP) involved in mRNA processing and transport